MQDRPGPVTDVHVIGVKIPFLELVVLLVKLALAMIPALFILTVASAVFWRVIAGLFGHHGQTTSL